LTSDKIKTKGRGWQDKFVVSTLSNVEVGRSWDQSTAFLKKLMFWLKPQCCSCAQTGTGAKQQEARVEGITPTTPLTRPYAVL